MGRHGHRELRHSGKLVYDVAPNNNVGASQFYNAMINRPGGASVSGNISPSILNVTIGPNAGNELLMGDTQQLELIGAFGGGRRRSAMAAR